MKKPTSLYFSAFRQDLRAVTKALDDDNFDSANIFSNRIMSNAVIGGDKNLGYAGFFLKELSLLLGGIRRRSETAAFTSAKAVAKECAKRFSDITSSPEFDSGLLWETYLGSLNQLRDFLKDDYERASYSRTDLEFVRMSFHWLLQFLKNERSVLLVRDSSLLDGILSEMNRLWKIHGIEMASIFAISLLVQLKRCNDYAKIAVSNPNEFKLIAEKTIVPYADKIVSILEQELPNRKEVETILWQLITKWREDFIRFMEIRMAPPFPIPYGYEKPVEIPEETREKLTKAITESLENGIKRE